MDGMKFKKSCLIGWDNKKKSLQVKQAILETFVSVKQGQKCFEKVSGKPRKGGRGHYDGVI